MFQKQFRNYAKEIDEGRAPEGVLDLIRRKLKGEDIERKD
jgi:hypothetical protein